MHIENEFVVAAPIDTVWKYLLDLELVAPCMPGAQLTEVVDDHTWKGRTSIKVGPVAMAFAGTVTMQDRDDDAHRVVLKARGMEQRGKGAASADVIGHVEEVEGGTKVAMETDLTISGAIAQYGRGMILDISQRLTKEFAQCLEANMLAAGTAAAEAAGASARGSAEAPLRPPAPEGAIDLPTGGEPALAGSSAAPARPAPATARPVKGIRLALWALWRAIVRFFRRLFGRDRSV